MKYGNSLAGGELKVRCGGEGGLFLFITVKSLMSVPSALSSKRLFAALILASVFANSGTAFAYTQENLPDPLTCVPLGDEGYYCSDPQADSKGLTHMTKLTVSLNSDGDKVTSFEMYSYKGSELYTSQTWERTESETETHIVSLAVQYAVGWGGQTGAARVDETLLNITPSPAAQSSNGTPDSDATPNTVKITTESTPEEGTVTTIEETGEPAVVLQDPDDISPLLANDAADAVSDAADSVSDAAESVSNNPDSELSGTTDDEAAAE